LCFMGRTQLSEDSPEVNSENLLVLLVPLIFVFGVSLFFSLLDQMNLLFRGMRYLVVGVFAVIICLPMEFTFFAQNIAGGVSTLLPARHPAGVRLDEGK